MGSMTELDHESIRKNIEDHSNGDLWKVELHAYEVFDTPITNPIVHFEVVFVDAEGSVNNVINGHPFECGSGEYAGGMRAASDGNVLKTMYGSDVSFGDITGHEPLVKIELGEMGTSEFFELRNRAREAGAVINAQNIPYVMMDPFQKGQNSNSVAFSVVKAMGLDVPPEVDAIWAPGWGRDLLPHDFQSFFDYFPVTNDNFGEFLPRQSNDARPGIYDEYTSRIFDPLGPRAVMRQAENTPKREDTDHLFYNPDRHTTPEEFGREAAHNYMHELGLGHSHSEAPAQTHTHSQ